MSHLLEICKRDNKSVFVVKHRFILQMTLIPKLSSSARRLGILLAEWTEENKGFAWPGTKRIMKTLTLSKDAVEDAREALKEHNLLRTIAVHDPETGERKGTEYYLAWERYKEIDIWDGKSADKNSTVEDEFPDVGEESPVGGGEISGTVGEESPPYKLEKISLGISRRDSLSANAPRESRDSRAAYATEVSTADAVVTGMDLVDSFLSVYPLTEYMVDQSSRDNAQNETEVRRVTTIRLKQVIRDGISFDTILAGARRYRDYVHSNLAAYVRSPQAWLAKGCWDDEPAPRSAAVNDNESLDRRIRSRRCAAI